MDPKSTTERKHDHITYSYSKLETFLTQPMWQEILKLLPTIIYRTQRERTKFRDWKLFEFFVTNAQSFYIVLTSKLFYYSFSDKA